jgi:hypothetical protein
MAHVSHDPRKDVRSTIGTSWWTQSDGDIYYIAITDNKGAEVKVPIFMAEEEKTESIKEMPWIEMDLADCIYEVGDVGGRTRNAEAYIDMSIEFANTDNIDATSFGKKVADELVNQIRTHQENCTFPATITFATVTNIRHIRENRAHQVVFKYIIELYVLFYDLC